MLHEFSNDLERAQALQNILISRATGGVPDEPGYKGLRTHFLNNGAYKDLLPQFVRTNRDLSQFWQFIKEEYGTYAERKERIWKDLTPLLDYLEGKNQNPADNPISDTLKSFDEDGVHSVWQRALERRASDPEGAITTARTLLETVCKHILDAEHVSYDANKTELPELYKLTASRLNLAPAQHTEEIFRQILGGCSAIVGGLGALRNRLGDAHGKGKTMVKPSTRHAELAVNLAGTMSLFLISTWNTKITPTPKI